jgi:cbb3-type cytochrome oxidase subunit 3
MADFWVLIFVHGFFALCVAFVYGCDKIIGPDDEADLDDEPDDGGVYTEIEVTA